MKTAKKSQEIREFIIESLLNKETKVASKVARKFNISRQAANRHLKKMIAEGVINAEGNIRSNKYSLKEFVSKKVSFDLNHEVFKDEIYGAPNENKAWINLIAPFLKDIPQNIYDICHYGFTEMLNNVFDHSNATKVTLQLVHNAAIITLFIIDDGIGIFKKIQQELHLEDPLYTLIELAKGKLTTDPKHHTGEGIFFSSRMFDEFIIVSGALRFVHIKAGEDWLLEKPDTIVEGTGIIMRINPNSKRTSKEVFDKFSTELEQYGFTKTKVPVALAKYGDENLISRSQAKRLLTRIDRFKEVILDFKNVESIGPAFADEIFRVFVNEHPDIELSFINENENVKRAIFKAQYSQ